MLNFFSAISIIQEIVVNFTIDSRRQFLSGFLNQVILDSLKSNEKDWT